MCNEFVKKQVAQNLTLTVNYFKDPENVTRVLQTANDFETWCLENFNCAANYMNILQMPELDIKSSGW